MLPVAPSSVMASDMVLIRVVGLKNVSIIAPKERHRRLEAQGVLSIATEQKFKKVRIRWSNIIKKNNMRRNLLIQKEKCIFTKS